MFLDLVILYGGNLGDQVKGRSPKKLKSLIEVPNLVHVKVHVLSFNVNPFLIPVACSYTELPICGKLWAIR